MKEIQMFPQITEETEENLLTLDEAECGQTSPKPRPPSLRHQHSVDDGSPLSSEYSSAVTSPVDGALPSDIDDTLLVPKIIAEYVESSNQQKTNAVNGGKFVSTPLDGNGVVKVDNNDEFSSPPARVRMRSLSGGTSRLSPSTLVSGRMRRQSGDDVLSSTSSPRRSPFSIDFRPRSKSDSKGKRPTFLSTLKNSFFSSSSNNNNSNNNNNQQQQDFIEPRPLWVPPDNWPRSRSSSDSKSGPVSKMIDIFRNRSNSISIDQRTKKSNSTTPGSAFMRRYSVDPSERRRHPLITSHKSLELPLDHQHHSLRKRSETFQDGDYEESPLIVPLFFDSCKCDQVMPVSGKVVILEVNLKVEKAFYSLVENAMRAAPVWDSSKMQFIGMLTISDFIDVLLYYNSKQEDIGDFENQKISAWRSITGKTDKFISIAPNASLTDAVKLLVQEKVHRLPIFDPKTQSVLYTLTHKRILRHFLMWGLGRERQIASIFPKPRFFAKSIRELKLGTFENIAIARYDMTVIEALRIFRERRVSAMPVIENNLVMDIYAKFDAFALATEKSYNNLNITIRQALREKCEYQEPLLTCTIDDTLQSILDKIVQSEVHRIIIVKPKRIFVGIISLSDILKFLLFGNTGTSDDTAPADDSSKPAQATVETKTPEDTAQQNMRQTDGAECPESTTNDKTSADETDSSTLQIAQTDLSSIPFVESADEDEVFCKGQTVDTSEGHSISECDEASTLAEKTLEEALE